MTEKMVIREYYELCDGGICQDLLTESEKHFVNNGGMILSGVIQRCGVPNGNGRIYTNEVLEREIGLYEKLVKISAKEFLEKILTNKLKVNHVVTGFDFVFGNNQLGDVKLIRDHCKKNRAFDFSEVSELREKNLEVSSSLVRNYLRKGNIEHANNILSRKWEVTSRVVSGEKKARMFGFKTANLKINNYCDLKFGVYAVKVNFLEKLSNKNLYGIANYGVKPTFKKKHPILEVHIFNFNEEIYGRKIKVSFINFIRSEKKFESIEKLKDQIIKDINSVKNNELFKNN